MKYYVGTRPIVTEQDWIDRYGWPPEEAKRLTEQAKGQRHTMVYVMTDVRVEDGALQGGEPLRHHVLHSPTGFEWGYGGSGPSDLARCILIDFLDLHDEAEADRDLRIPGGYMDFKAEVIAKLPKSGFMLTEAEIREWREARV